MTKPQHMQALALANEARKRRSQLRFEVSGLEHDAGRALVADVISDGFDAHDDVRRAVTNARVVDVIRWVRKMYAHIAVRYAAAVGAAEARTVGELTDRQRYVLADVLRGGVERLHDVEEENGFELWRRQHDHDHGRAA